MSSMMSWKEIMWQVLLVRTRSSMLALGGATSLLRKEAQYAEMVMADLVGMMMVDQAGIMIADHEGEYIT
jgi:hypothetical protein